MENLATSRVIAELRKRLPSEVWQPNSQRLYWFCLHLGAVAGAFITAKMFGTGSNGLNWPLLLPLSIVVGFAFGGLAFVAHETLHGATVSSLRLRNWIGRIGFAPFCVSPRLWMAWHNRVHHNQTNVDGRDPDAYPSLDEYWNNRAARLAVDWGAPRTGKWRGLITLLLGFTLQSAQILWMAKRRGHLSLRHHRIAVLESLAAFGFWILCAGWLGAPLFIVLYLVPLVIANVIVMSYIVTNHSLSPLVERDDPLSSTLSVTVPRWYEQYSLQFGYHVEHHLFPSMSHSHGPQVRDELLKLAPLRYQSLPLGRALQLIFKSPRVYKDRTLLFDPATHETQPTLGLMPKPVGAVLDAPLLPIDSENEITEIRTRSLRPSQAPPRAS